MTTDSDGEPGSENRNYEVPIRVESAESGSGDDGGEGQNYNAIPQSEVFEYPVE